MIFNQSEGLKTGKICMDQPVEDNQFGFVRQEIFILNGIYIAEKT